MPPFLFLEQPLASKSHKEITEPTPRKSFMILGQTHYCALLNALRLKTLTRRPPLHLQHSASGNLFHKPKLGLGPSGFLFIHSEK